MGKTRIPASHSAYIVADDLRDLVKTAIRPSRPALDERGQKALADLKRDGFAVVPNFWDRQRALRIRDELEALGAGGEDKDWPEGAYLRHWNDRAYDSGVSRLWHVEKLIPELAELRNDPFVMSVTAAYYKQAFYSGGLVFQHNTKTNKETRGYHVDGFAREFKSFVYLDDVNDGNGPFAYLRGTHREHLVRLRKQIIGGDGSPTLFSREDVKDADSREERIHGEAGTLILSDVRGLHRGTPQRESSRSVLVNYIVKHPGDLHMDR